MKKIYLVYILMIAVLTGCIGNCTVPNTSNENILMITDIHLDPYNSCGESVTVAATNCVLNLINESNPANWHFHSGLPNAFGQETNNSFFELGLHNLSLTVSNQQIDKIFITGDLLSHHFPNQFESYVPSGTQQQQTALAVNTINYVLYKISQAVPQAKIYYIFGNNDTDQSDYSYPTESFMQLITPIVANYAPNPNKIQQTFAYGGYYIMPLNDNTDVIGLNFNPLTVENAGNLVDKRIAESQLVWLKQQLADERSQHKKVIVLQHEPFGMNMFNIVESLSPSHNLESRIQDQYLQLYTSYHDIIINYYYGHYHMEDIQTGVGIFGVSSLGFSVDFYNNPGFKILQLNSVGELQNYTSYYSQYADDHLLKWSELYQLNAAYGITPDQYLNYFSHELKPKVDSRGWLTYVRNYSGNNIFVSPQQMPINIPNSWAAYFCAINYFEPRLFDLCLAN